MNFMRNRAMKQWIAPSFIVLVLTGCVREQPARLRVMTLNLAHGRGRSSLDVFQSRSEYDSNIQRVAQLIIRESPDLVAVQEADRASPWSGNFDHVAKIADMAGYSHICHGEHVRAIGMDYGTAILSRHPISESKSYRFQPSPPSLSKGFVSATVLIPGFTNGIEVSSVHLDFLQSSVRSRQVNELIEALKDSERPLIVMGDFNCGWDANQPLQKLAQKLKMQTVLPEAEDMGTFHFSGARIDWIFASSGLVFEEYVTLPDVVSDHAAVVAELSDLTQN